MSYVNEILERVAAQNPGQPEFLQAVTEVLESLRVVIEKNEDYYRKNAFLGVSSPRSGSSCSVFPGWTTRARFR